MPNSMDYESKLRDLTQRQCEILYWVCQGLTFKEVSSKIGFGEDLVTAEMSRIYKTFGLTQQRRNAKRHILEDEICPIHLGRVSNPELDCRERVIEVNAPAPDPKDIQEVIDDAKGGMIPLKGAMIPVGPSRGPQPPTPPPGGLATRPTYPVVGATPAKKGKPWLWLLIGILGTILVLTLCGITAAFTVGRESIGRLFQPTAAPIIQTVVVAQPPTLQTQPPATVLITQPPITVLVTQPAATVFVTQPAPTPLPPIIQTVIVTDPAPTPMPTTIAIHTVVVTAPPPTSTSLPTPKPVLNPCTATGDTVDLTGQVASDLPGTEVCVGSSVSSVIDQNTKPQDYYAIELQAGRQVQFQVSPSNCVGVRLFNPQQAQSDDFTTAFQGGACNDASWNLTPAVSGIYYFRVTANNTGIVYTFATKFTAVQVPGDQVASDLPGTVLTLGSEVTSVIDQNTKPQDFYAIDLTAGQRVRFEIEPSNCVGVRLFNPRQTQSDDFTTAFQDGACNDASWNFTPAVSGTYYFRVTSNNTGIIYKVRVNSLN